MPDAADGECSQQFSCRYQREMEQDLKAFFHQSVDERIFSGVFEHRLAVEQDFFMVAQGGSQQGGMQRFAVAVACPPVLAVECKGMGIQSEGRGFHGFETDEIQPEKGVQVIGCFFGQGGDISGGDNSVCQIDQKMKIIVFMTVHCIAETTMTVIKCSHY